MTENRVASKVDLHIVGIKQMMLDKILREGMKQSLPTDWDRKTFYLIIALRKELKY